MSEEIEVGDRMVDLETGREWTVVEKTSRAFTETATIDELRDFGIEFARAGKLQGAAAHVREIRRRIDAVVEQTGTYPPALGKAEDAANDIAAEIRRVRNQRIETEETS